MHNLSKHLGAILIPAVFVPAMLLAQAPRQTIVLRDGRQLAGSMVAADDHEITFRERDGDLRHFRFDEIQTLNFLAADRDDGRARLPEAAPPPPPPPPPPADYDRSEARRMIVPAGTEVAIRTNENIDSRDASESRSYATQVDRDIADTNGRIVVPRGSEAWLVVRRMPDNKLALDLQSVTVNGARYAVDTQDVVAGRSGIGGNKRTGEFVGGGAALGALLGAVTGGGKGAGIGALAGGAAGAVGQVATKGDHVRVPPETVLNFRLDAPVHLHPIA